MPYMNLDPNFFSHLKVWRLREALQDPNAEIYILRLWAYCAIHCLWGRLKGYKPEDLEHIMRWKGEPGGLIKVLLTPPVDFLTEHEDFYDCTGFMKHQGHLAIYKKRAKIAAKARWSRNHEGASKQGMLDVCLSNAPTVPDKHAVPDEHDIYSSAFMQFWTAYPRKVSKHTAWLKWKSLNPNLTMVLSALEKQKQSKQWEDIQYIPHPATWLNQHRWEDESSPIEDESPEDQELRRLRAQKPPGENE